MDNATQSTIIDDKCAKWIDMSDEVTMLCLHVDNIKSEIDSVERAISGGFITDTEIIDDLRHELADMRLQLILRERELYWLTKDTRTECYG